MVELKINEDNKPIVWISAIALVISIFFYTVYEPMRGAMGIYGFFALVSLMLYTNPAFQDYLYGIPLKAKSIIYSLLVGGAVGGAFFILPHIIPGMSMGIPLLPRSISTQLQWAIICLFAPILEDVVRFGILGIVKYLRREEGVNKIELWIAIITQAIFFTAIHATAYAAGWYEAPTWLGAFGIISAVSASLLAAFIFAMVTGYLVTRDGFKNILLSIVAHYVINQVLFVKMAVVGFYILPIIVKFINPVVEVII